MTVVDASIVVRLLLNRPDDEALHERVGRHQGLHAPALVDAEVSSAIRGLVMTSKPAVMIPLPRAEEMLEDLGDLPLVRHPLQPLQRRVLRLRHNLTTYDGFYVALAERLNLPLLTDDRKYAEAAGHDAQVETWP